MELSSISSDVRANAVSVMPISAQTVVNTSTEGLETGEVSIPVKGFQMPAYRAQPKGKTGLPVYFVQLRPLSRL